MLSVCSSAGSLNHGKQIHSAAIKAGEALSVSVSNALITMYAKAGNITCARRVFDIIHLNRDTVSWTSMILALAQHRLGNEALELFDNMLALGMKPDHITYVGVITPCTHVGLVDQGRSYYKMMKEMHAIEPTSNHCACMIDLFGRAGLLEEAQDFIENMPIEPDMVAWGSLLASCRVHEKVELAKVAADRLLSIDPENSGAYSTLANVYSSCGKWDEAAKIRNSMKEKQVKKEQGFSWIQIKNIVHVFGVEDGIHPQRDAIYKTMEKIWKDIKKIGFIPDTASLLHDLDFEVNEQILRHHSEKLTIAFGLINTPENTTLRIMKNLRVCNDCHSAIKFISKLVGREIIVRDATRFHHFKGGSCSCNDYWSKHRNDPQTMKKLCQKHARKDKKKESGSKKRGHNSPESKAPVKTRRVVEDIYRYELPKYSYANIVPIADEFEKLDLAHTSFASEQHGTSSMPSSSKNQDQRRYRVNVPQVTEDHDNFDDFSSTPPQFFMRQSIHVSRTVSKPMTKTTKDVLIGGRSDSKKQTQLRDAEKKQTTDMKEKSKVDVDSTSTLNRKDLVVKADLHSLASEMKAYMKTYIDQKFKDLEHLMNARFTEVLNSLEQKNETVKQSRQECDLSDAIVDDAGPTSTDSVVKETDKPVEMEDDKANQAPSFPKKGEQHEKDVGIEKQSDAAVEEIHPLESIIPDVAKDLITQDASLRIGEVADMEKSLINTIKGLSMCAGQPWHMVNKHKVSTDWTALKSYEKKSERDPFQVEYVSEIAQQDSGSLDCGVFMAVYAEYLSEALGISCSEFILISGDFMGEWVETLKCRNWRSFTKVTISILVHHNSSYDKFVASIIQSGDLDYASSDVVISYVMHLREKVNPMIINSDVRVLTYIMDADADGFRQILRINMVERSFEGPLNSSAPPPRRPTVDDDLIDDDYENDVDHTINMEDYSMHMEYLSSDSYDVMTTNIAKSLNSILMDEREYPVSYIFNSIAKKFGEKFRERHSYVCGKENIFVPSSERILRNNKSVSDSLYVSNPNGVLDEYTVFENGVTAKVNLLERSCFCRKFDLVKMLCEHAMAALRAKYDDGEDYGNTIYDYSSPIYKAESYLLAYSKAINIVPPKAEWTVPQELVDTKISLPRTIPNSEGRKSNALRASVGHSSPKGGIGVQYATNSDTKEPRVEWPPNHK
ncbi:Pentatricopeptide repeat-containing protein [Capsicum baccatum]|uniref:Pentatricopeptide repeat-containing protein n=1 Tax=Capsicum baccatum TaxID=33114 RepID=A0A2G2VGQ4_CAPBA|nr:Pentatricopeptide repeat-containing protein [Capsicum baccatum]